MEKRLLMSHKEEPGIRHLLRKHTSLTEITESDVVSESFPCMKTLWIQHDLDRARVTISILDIHRIHYRIFPFSSLHKSYI